MANTKVTQELIADDAIGAAQLASNAVVTASIADDAVTSAKLDTNLSVAGSLTAVGTLTANAGINVDNINIDGTTIALSTGDLSIFSSGSDQDVLIKGNDGGSAITALTLDMSDNGKAIFNGGATFASDVVITLAGNSDNLTLTTTDADATQGPNLRHYRNSSSPANDDQVGRQDYEGRNNNSQDVVYARTGTQIKDVTDGSEDGRFFINTMVAGTLQSRIDIQPTETVFNNESIDLDFRVESNINVNSLFVSGETGNVGIGGVPVASYDGYDTAALHIHQTQGSNHGSQIHLTNATTGAAAGNGMFISMWSDDDVYFTNQESDGNIIFASGGNSNVLVISDSGVVTSKTSANITQQPLATSGTTISWNALTHANAYLVPAANLTIDNPSNSVEGAIISVEIAMNGTPRTIAWHTNFEFAASTAPTATATANKTDIFSFRYNGSVWQEIGRVQNLAQT